MVEIVRLKPGEQPPRNERFIHILWKPGDSDVMVSQSWGTTYRVPTRLWDQWLEQGPGLAERVGLRKLYVTDPPGRLDKAAQGDAGDSPKAQGS